ncbi:MAG: hypothetical protein IJO43_03945 [Bacilli bacterium]|nr:hypothetical protein [Bacilli bacterium]
MEKKNVGQTTTVNGVARAHLSAGIVSLIKVVDGEYTLKKGETAVYLPQQGNKTVIALDIRKAVFEEKDGYGEDIFYSFGEGGYRYKIAGVAGEEYRNNTIVIRNIRNLNDLLCYAGIPYWVDDLSEGSVRKMVLSSEELLMVKKHQKTLTESGIIEPERVKEINSQACFLYQFKKSNLPTKPQRVEKVYLKYFK